MIVDYIDGDIIRIWEAGNNIAHGCNCFHTMGAGVAGQLASKYPQVLSTDKAGSDYGDRNKLGSFTVVQMFDPLNIELNPGLCFNMYTQFYPGKHFELVYLLMALQKYFNQTNQTLYIPRIGAGIGGGDWEEISAGINSLSGIGDIIVVDYKEPQ